MKCPAPALCLALLAAILPAPADVVHLKNGNTESGRIVKTDGQTVTIEKSIGSGKAEIPYPLSMVAKVTFEPTAGEKQLVATGDTKQLEALEALWKQREAFLGLAESDSAAVGLAYIRLLLAKGTKTAGQEGVKVAEAIIAKSWNASSKTDAQRQRLSALAAAGKVEQALAEAATLQNLPGTDDAGLMETRVKGRFLKADLAWKQVREFEEEWPKWDLMPDLRKHREALLSAAVDDYLFPAVFHPELTALTAEGLWKASGIFLHTGRPEEAAARAREIILYFPVQPYQEQARKRVAQLEKENPALKP